MNLKKTVLFITYLLILCGIARGVPILNTVTLATCKFLLILISIGAFIASPEIFRNKIVIYLMLFLTYMSFTFLFTDNASITYYSNTMAAMLMFAPFYYFSKNEVINQKNLTVFVVALLVVICVSFQNVHSQTIVFHESENVTTNYGYFFVTIFPLAFILNKNWLTYIIVFIALIGTVIAAKRGAVFIISFIALYFFYISIFNNGQKFNIAHVVITLIIFAVTVQYVYELILNTESFHYKFEAMLEGNSSGRDEISSMCIEYLFNESVLNLLFGNGYFSTLRLIGIEAHNDWLQSLMDYGLIGTLFYSLFVVTLFKEVQITTNIIHQHVLIVILFTWISKSLFSMQYCNFNSILIMMVLGIVIGQKNRQYENCLFD